MTTTTRVDHYPSRVGAERRLLDRQDPVIWGGDTQPGPLTPEQLRGFDRDGYIVLDDWLDDATVRRCLGEMDALGRDIARTGDERAVLEPESTILRSLFEVHHVSPVYADLVAHERLAGVARQILADDVYIHQSRVNLKPALHGQDFAWHSDFETWHVEDGMPAMRAVSCSVALTDNHVWNGPLLLIGGSHRRYVSFDGFTPEDNYRRSLREQEYGVPDLDTLVQLHEAGDIATFAGKAGSVVFFDCNIMHGSPSNISPRSRTNAFLVYNAWSNRLQDPFGTDAPRPTHIADRNPPAPV